MDTAPFWCVKVCLHPAASKLPRLAIVEVEPLYQELCVTGLISRLPDVVVVVVVGPFTSGEGLLHGLDMAGIDILLADDFLGSSLDGPQVEVRLRRRRPCPGIVLLSNLAMTGLRAGLPADVRGG